LPEPALGTPYRFFPSTTPQVYQTPLLCDFRSAQARLQKCQPVAVDRQKLPKMNEKKPGSKPGLFADGEPSD